MSHPLDVDLTFDVAESDHGELIRAVRALKDERAINVEEASPGDFIPLPEGFQNRAHYVGRFGNLDVYHFDVYSVALSKIERGRDADFAEPMVWSSRISRIFAPTRTADSGSVIISRPRGIRGARRPQRVA